MKFKEALALAEEEIKEGFALKIHKIEGEKIHLETDQGINPIPFWEADLEIPQHNFES
jgi:hypothetical protein